MKKVLLLTDFSDASKTAIRFAQVLFSHTAVEFCLLHAYPVEPDTLYGTTFLMEEAEQNAYRSLQHVLSELVAQFHPPFHSYRIQTVPGSPIGAVEAALEQTDYNYVVVGATGSGMFPLLGSVATGLIRHAKTNVLVVPSHVAVKPVRSVVLATDYRTLHGQTALGTLTNLLNFQEDSQATRLTALTVADSGQPLVASDDYERYCRYLNQTFESVQIDPYFVLDDDVMHGIETYLATHEVDLLVTVPHRKTLLDAVWNRSLTRRLAYRPRVPLLSLYDPEPAESLESKKAHSSTNH